jgi:hypothetical protein
VNGRGLEGMGGVALVSGEGHTGAGSIFARLEQVG